MATQTASTASQGKEVQVKRQWDPSKPMPINLVNRDDLQKALAGVTGLTVQQLRGVRKFMNAEIQLSDCVSKYVKKWLESSVHAKLSGGKCPTLDQLLAGQPEGLLIKVKKWKDGKPIEDDVIAHQYLPRLMLQLYVNLSGTVRGDKSKLVFEAYLPLLNKDKNPAASALLEAVTNLHKAIQGATPIQVQPELVGENESNLELAAPVQAKKA